MRVHPLACALLLSMTGSARAQEPPPGSPMPPPSASQEPPPSNLEAGGLRPPEAVDSQQPATQDASEAQVKTELDQADTEDTGRGLEFVWLKGEVGYQMMGLLTEGLVDGADIEDTQSGLMFGGGVGVRLFVFTLGARFRYSSFEAWNMWSINGEAAFHIPLGNLDLYFGLGAGYASLGNFQGDSADASASLGDLTMRGLDVRAGLGLDYYFSNTFSVGVNIGGEVLILKRSALYVPDDEIAFYAMYHEEKGGFGAAFTPAAVLGLHF